MTQGHLKLLRAIILDTQVWFAGITKLFTTTVCFTWEGNVWETKCYSNLSDFFRSTMIYTLIEDSERGSTNIDTTAAFAWQRLVLGFPYMKEIFDLKTLRLQMLIWHNRT